jgi:hypothetical protein
MGGLTGDKTNIIFIADTSKPCPPEYNNVLSNTNLLTPDEQITDINSKKLQNVTYFGIGDDG